MDFELREEETTVAELARQILEDRVTNERLKELEGIANKIEDKKSTSDEPVFDEHLWKSLGEANLLGAAIPEEHGGMDLGYMALCLLLQEIGRTVAPVPAYATLALGALPIAAFGNDAVREEWLPRIASGEAILTAALSELDSSDPLRPTTRAEAAGGGFRLTGEKSLVPAAQLAQRILVPATLDGGDIALFLVDPSADGVELEHQQSSDRQPHALLALEGAAVSEADALGGLEGGAERLRWIVERATVARCAMQLGVTERALEMTAQYGRDRIQFERPIGSFQAFHQRAADAYIQVECIRLATWEAAWRLGQGLESASAVAVAKHQAADAGAFTAYACQHLHGGIGIDIDYPLHRYFIWAIQIEHELGCAPLQLEKLGDHIAEHGVAEYDHS